MTSIMNPESRNCIILPRLNLSNKITRDATNHGQPFLSILKIWSETRGSIGQVTEIKV